MIPKTSLSLLFSLAWTALASAQSAGWTDHGYVSAMGDFRVTTSSFADVVHPIVFAEPADVNTTYQVKTSPGFDIGGGVRVWRNLALGADVSRETRGDSGSVDAQVPHPFFFNQLRPVSGEAARLTREETAVHVQALWMIPLNARWQMAIAGGPSWFTVRQDVVQDVTITQTYPYDTATFAGVVTQRVSKSRAGFNSGIDLTYLVAPHVGILIGAQFSHARIPFGATASSDAGGMHVGGGLRFRF